MEEDRAAVSLQESTQYTHLTPPSSSQIHSFSKTLVGHQDIPLNQSVDAYQVSLKELQAQNKAIKIYETVSKIEYKGCIFHAIAAKITNFSHIACIFRHYREKYDSSVSALAFACRYYQFSEGKYSTENGEQQVDIGQEERKDESKGSQDDQ